MQFIKQLNVKIRAKQRNKRKPREEFREKLYKKRHATKRERFLCTGTQDNYHHKWERFIPKQCIHINQSPLLFALDIKQTYGHYEKGKGHEHNTWLSTPGEGLTKT